MSSREHLMQPVEISGQQVWQMPLLLNSQLNDRVGSLLRLSNPESERILQLLLKWSKKYGKVDIHVSNGAILIGDEKISLSDINAINAYKSWVLNFNGILCSPSGEFIFKSPQGDLVDIETWMNLINRIPGIGVERTDNLLELLGHKNGLESGAYWTNEALWPTDTWSHYWQLCIDRMWIQRNERLSESSMPEGDYECDRWIYDFGDDYIFFDYAAVEAPCLTGGGWLLRMNA